MAGRDFDQSVFTALKKQVFIPNKDYFEVCLGCLRIACQMRGGACFAASLLAHKQQPDDWTVLDRLAVCNIWDGGVDPSSAAGTFG